MMEKTSSPSPRKRKNTLRSLLNRSRDGKHDPTLRTQSNPVHHLEKKSNARKASMPVLPKAEVMSPRSPGKNLATSENADVTKLCTQRQTEEERRRELVSAFLLTSASGGEAWERWKKNSFFSLMKGLNVTPTVTIDPSFKYKRLNLGGKNMGKDRLIELCELLRETPVGYHITQLDLFENKLGDEGIALIGKLLEESPPCCTNLVYLDLRFNEISTKGFQALLHSLNNNFRLEKVQLDEASDLGAMGMFDIKVNNPFLPQVQHRINYLMLSNREYHRALTGNSKKIAMVDRLLECIPMEVFDCVHLEELKWALNRVHAIPKEIANLVHLRILDLSQNEIEELPSEISHLYSLEILNLNHNHIEHLWRVDWTSLSKLQILRLEHNRLLNIPRFSIMMNLPNLRSLEIHGNPLTQLVLMEHPQFRSIVTNATKNYGAKTLKWMREHNAGTEEVYRMKLMLVGNGNVGKTTLLKRMTSCLQRSRSHGHAITSPAENVATDGILITELVVPISETGDGVLSEDVNDKHTKEDSGNGKEDTKKAISFSCWDFAGQEVYYSTHSLFLSDRSLYLLVFNLLESESESRIDYWLQSISARCKDKANVILVGTHLEDKRCTKKYVEEYWNSIMKKYGTRTRYKRIIRAYHSVSNETKKGISGLLNDLQRIAMKLHFMPDNIPLSYLAVEESVIQLRIQRNPPVISWEVWKTILVKRGIASGGVSSVTQFLHSLGVVVYFGDDDSRLRDLVILDPQWIADTFASIISLKWGFVRNGVLDARLLIQIWRPPRYPVHLHDTIVSLLERFQAVSRFQAPSSEELKLLIPCMFPEKPPVDTPEIELYSLSGWNFGRIYRFTFVPLGFFSRVIVRALAGSEYLPLLYWKHGLVLQTHNKDVLIRLTIQDPVSLLSSSDLRPVQDFQSFSSSPSQSTSHKEPVGAARDLSSSGEGTDEKSKWPVSMQVVIKSTTNDRKDLSKRFTAVLSNIDSLIADWLHISKEIQIPCSHCMREGLADPYLFRMEDVESSVARGNETVKCREVHDVDIAALAPDISISAISDMSSPNEMSSISATGSVPTVNYGDVTKVKQIGNGEYALVYEAIWNGERYAMKELKVGTLGSGDKLEVFSAFRREVFIMCGMNHPNLLSLRGICLEPFSMLLEYMPLGSLYHYIHDPSQVLSWSVVLKIAKDVAMGMQFMHNYTPKLIHGDLKSPNILLGVERVTYEGKDSRFVIQAKVADFGITRSVVLGNKISGKAIDNPIWLAPELIRKSEYDEKVDVYSFGVILWELVSRQDFFADVKNWIELERKILANERPPIPTFCLEEYPIFAELIQRCWANDSKTRPTFAEILALLQSFKTKDQLPAILLPAAVLEQDPIAVQPKKSIEPVVKQASKNPKREPLYGTQFCKTISQRSGIQVLRSLTREPGLVWGGTSDGRCLIFELRQQGFKLTSELNAHGATITCILPVCVSKIPVPSSLLGAEAKEEVWTAAGDGGVKVWTSRGESKSDLSGSELIVSMTSVTLAEKVLVWAGAHHLKGKKKGLNKELTGMLLVWDAKSYKLKKTIQLETTAPRSLVHHNDAVWIACGACLYEFSCKKYQLRRCVGAHKEEISRVLVVGKELWTCSEDKLLKIWNTKTELTEENCIRTLEGHLGFILDICTDGCYVWSCGWDKQIFLWDGKAKKFAAALPQIHSEQILSLTVTKLGKESYILSASKDGSICLWH